MRVTSKFGYGFPTVYAERDSWSDIVHLSFGGDTYEVLDDSDTNWYKVRTDSGKVGYVLKAKMKKVRE